VLLAGFHRRPCVVDLAAMRDALRDMGADPKRANPLIPADLVIDHSVQVDQFGTAGAFRFNALLEFQRNQERYAFLRWGQKAFQDFRVVPPDTGIVHQVNLEYLRRWSSPIEAIARAGVSRHAGRHRFAHHHDQRPGRGRLGRRRHRSRGVHARPAHLDAAARSGRIQAEGPLAEGCTATDLVLTVTQMLRKKGVVGKFVEFYGPAWRAELADRATIGNMAPEYGATIGFFPIDHQTLDYLRLTNRSRNRSRWWKPTPRRRACSSRPIRPSPSIPTLSNSISRPWFRPWPVPSGRRIASIFRM
jgi:aconitate hydratase